jgi:hypothetical protein
MNTSHTEGKVAGRTANEWLARSAVLDHAADAMRAYASRSVGLLKDVADEIAVELEQRETVARICYAEACERESNKPAN